MTYTVAALYQFTSLPDYAALRPILQDMCDLLEINGTLLLAHEGINGTISGSAEAVDSILDFLRADPRLAALDAKFSQAESSPFYRMKVRLKSEIVTMGVDGIDPNVTVGTYVEPTDWNALITDPDTILIDTRNDYEVDIGTFRGAVDPKTKTFRDFPAWVDANRDRLDKPKVAMFCTGGIRCEKASAYMKSNGFDDVYHLKGGILKYLETQPKDESLWDGECFVFDQRVAVGHGLVQGSYDQCYHCRLPLSETDKARPEYEAGIVCHNCVDDISPQKRAGLAERQKQMALARARGDLHIGRKDG